MLRSTEAWLPSRPDWGPCICNAGLRLPPTRKMAHMALCSTLLAGETSMPPKDTHTFRGPTHHRPVPDGPPEQYPQLSPPESLSPHWHLRPAMLPGPNPNTLAQVVRLWTPEA